MSHLLIIVGFWFHHSFASPFQLGFEYRTFVAVFFDEWSESLVLISLEAHERSGYCPEDPALPFATWQYDNGEKVGRWIVWKADGSLGVVSKHQPPTENAIQETPVSESSEASAESTLRPNRDSNAT